MDSNNKENLYRSRSNRIIGGVAGGLAAYFNIDPILVRIAFVALFFFNGLGLLLYVLLLFVIPKNPGEVDTSRGENVREFTSTINEKVQSVAQEFKGEGVNWGGHRNIIGLVVLAFGVLALLAELTDFHIRFELLWPLVLIILGFLILFKK